MTEPVERLARTRSDAAPRGKVQPAQHGKAEAPTKTNEAKRLHPARTRPRRRRATAT